MAITKSQIQTEVARRAGRNSSDVTDAEIEAAILYLTLRVELLRSELTTSTVAGRAYYDLRSVPSHFRGYIVAKIDDGEPLERIRSWADYQSLISDETSADRGEPEAFIVYDDYIYLHETPDAVYTLTLYCSVMEMNADSISVPDRFAECLYELVTYHVLKNKGMADSDQGKSALAHAMEWIKLFQSNELDKLNVDCVQYNDI